MKTMRVITLNFFIFIICKILHIINCNTVLSEIERAKNILIEQLILGIILMKDYKGFLLPTELQALVGQFLSSGFCQEPKTYQCLYIRWYRIALLLRKTWSILLPYFTCKIESTPYSFLQLSISSHIWIVLSMSNFLAFKNLKEKIINLLYTPYYHQKYSEKWQLSNGKNGSINKSSIWLKQQILWVNHTTKEQYK